MKNRNSLILKSLFGGIRLILSLQNYQTDCGPASRCPVLTDCDRLRRCRGAVIEVRILMLRAKRSAVHVGAMGEVSGRPSTIAPILRRESRSERFNRTF